MKLPPGHSLEWQRGQMGGSPLLSAHRASPSNPWWQGAGTQDPINHPSPALPTTLPPPAPAPHSGFPLQSRPLLGGPPTCPPVKVTILCLLLESRMGILTIPVVSGILLEPPQWQEGESASPSPLPRNHKRLGGQHSKGLWILPLFGGGDGGKEGNSQAFGVTDTPFL